MSKRAFIFAERNIKEIMRSPASWIFGLALPVGLFAIMQIIIKSIGADAAAQVPMFGVARFTGGVLLFGAAFLSLFCAILISGDRAQSFLPRLFASPMTSAEFIVGYMLAAMPVALAQNVVTFAVALCFGLEVSANILLAMLFSLLFSLLFIAVGVIFGSLLGPKNAAPICSAAVQVAVLLSGMWFDLDMIGGGFAVFCRVLPFANLYDLIRFSLSGEYARLWKPFVIVAAYAVAMIVLSVLAFSRTGKRERRG